MNVQTNYANMPQGHSNTIIHQSLADVLPKLAEFISEVRKADFIDKEDAIRDLEKAYRVGARSIEQWCLGTYSIKIKSAETTMKLAGYAYSAYTLEAAASKARTVLLEGSNLPAGPALKLRLWCGFFLNANAGERIQQ
jgi:hypothetical protein